MYPVALPPPAPTWSTISHKAFSLDYALINTPESIKRNDIKLPSSVNFDPHAFSSANLFDKRLNSGAIILKSYSLRDYLVEPPMIYPVFPAR